MMAARAPSVQSVQSVPRTVEGMVRNFGGDAQEAAEALAKRHIATEGHDFWLSVADTIRKAERGEEATEQKVLRD